MKTITLKLHCFCTVVVAPYGQLPKHTFTDFCMFVKTFFLELPLFQITGQLSLEFCRQCRPLFRSQITFLIPRATLKALEFIELCVNQFGPVIVKKKKWKLKSIELINLSNDRVLIPDQRMKMRRQLINKHTFAKKNTVARGPMHTAMHCVCKCVFCMLLSHNPLVQYYDSSYQLYPCCIFPLSIPALRK